jgi:hypothetical protein
MSLKRVSFGTDSKKSDFKPQNLEEGDYEGRLVYVADLGLQSRNFKGEEKPPAQQVALGIEVIGKPVEIDGEKKPRILWTAPFNIFRTMNEKGKEYAYFKLFNPKAHPDTVANWESVLGTPVSVTVIHVKGKGENADRTYDNIQNLAAIPVKYQADVGPALTTPGVGDADDETNPVTAALFGLPKFVWDRRLEAYAPPVKAAKPTKKVDAEPDEDVPF